MLEPYTSLKPQGTKIVVLGYNNGQVLVIKFYHERANQNFLKCFTYKGDFEIKSNGVYYQRKVYIYKKNDLQSYTMPEFDIFPKTYSRTMGFSINGFNFAFSGDEFLKKKQ